MTNPIYKEILKGFVEHLERRDSSNGWQIISKPSYDNKSTYTKSSPMQSKTQRKVKRMFWEWYEMGSDELEFEIESFLRKWETTKNG